MVEYKKTSKGLYPMLLNEALAAACGAQPQSAVPISGGDINDAYRLTLEDGARVFMKANRTASPAFFEAEADGLDALRATGAIGVPEVIAVGEDPRFGRFLLLEWVAPGRPPRDYWESFGRSLAAMHRASAVGFGWHRDNYIGSNKQANARRDSWVEFFRDCRLAPQFANAQRYFDASAQRQIDRLLDRLGNRLVEPSRPSLLHGDLWSGNFIVGADGKPWLIDPAVYVGHAEADLAMTELFGGFHPSFYDAYREVNPLQAGYPERRDLYNLYHLLNHLNLFGGGYLPSVLKILKKYS